MKCIRCGSIFGGLDSAERCPNAPDGGAHEPAPHDFKQGRLDGLCSHPREGLGMCGYDRFDERIHPQVLTNVG